MTRDILRDRIESIQRAWRRTALWEQVWLGVLVLTGLVAAAGLADLLVPLPAAARLALWGLGAALALGGLVRLTATRRRRRIDPGRAALLAEKRYPHLQDQLASAVWYAGREAETSSPVAAHLVDRLLTEARKEARVLGFSDVVPRGRLVRRLAAAVAAAGSLALLGSVFPETVGAQLVRVLQPWRPVPPVLATRVHVEPGDAALRRGSDQSLRAVLTGPGSPAADLHVRPGERRLAGPAHGGGRPRYLHLRALLRGRRPGVLRQRRQRPLRHLPGRGLRAAGAARGDGALHLPGVHRPAAGGARQRARARRARHPRRGHRHLHQGSGRGPAGHGRGRHPGRRRRRPPGALRLHPHRLDHLRAAGPRPPGTRGRVPPPVPHRRRPRRGCR